MNSIVVSGKKLKKTDAYKEFALYANKVTKSDWTDKQAKGRYESLLKAYKTVKRSQTGWGVTEADTENGIFTIDEKLESMCQFFSK
jgi:hypothetical protein